MTALGEERVVVIGAGSLGTVYGAALARAGLDVQLLAREEHARAIQESGAVTIDSFGERWQVPLRADWRPERIEPAEIVDPAHEDAGHAGGARLPRARSGYGPDRRFLPERRREERRPGGVERPRLGRGRSGDGRRHARVARPREAHDERALLHRGARRLEQRARRPGSRLSSRPEAFPSS